MEKIKISYGYIYKILNRVNGKIYIGQNKGGFNANYFGSGTGIKNAIKKYGKNFFVLEVIDWANSAYKLDCLEKRFIAEHREAYGKEFLYNMSSGGEHGKNSGKIGFKKGSIPWNKGLHIQLNTGRTQFKKGSKLNLETKRKIQLAMTGEKNPFFGKKHSAEAIKKMEPTWFKKKHE